MSSGQWVVLLGALVSACAGPPRLGASRVYAQQLGDDSISEHCKYHPEVCLEAFGPETGTAAAPAATTIDGAAAIGTGVLGASIVTTTQLSQTEQARIIAVLRQCADQAYASVLKERFGGRNPSQEKCNEHIGTARNGEPISLAMQLGDEMHRATYQCLNDRLPGLIGNRYSIEQRYRYNPRNQRTTVVKKEDEEWLDRHGRGDELRDSIVPDLMIHRGDPRFVQAAYDFKFPCASPHSTPPWRPYPSGHPATGPRGTDQGEVYRKVLNIEAVFRVVPGHDPIP